MDFVADENVHGDIIRWLRTEGHHVLWAAESLPSEADLKLLELARVQQRILLTADKDFGELVFHRGLLGTGVILMRLEKLPIADRIDLLKARWTSIESRAPGHFITVGRRRTRIRPMPEM